MFADPHHSAHLPATGRLGLLFWRLVHAFQPARSSDLSSELGKLSDRMLRDIGVERSDLPPVLDELITRADMLESRAAVAAYLAATTR